jgi:hypothetical protein
VFNIRRWVSWRNTSDYSSETIATRLTGNKHFATEENKYIGINEHRLAYSELGIQ